MSWLVGSFTEPAERLRQTCPGTPLISHEQGELVIFAGGNPRTCRQGNLPNGEAFILLGYPVLREGDRYHSPSDSELREILQKDDFRSHLDGHYLILIISGDGLRAYNDDLGKRSLYIYKTEGRYLFTTSLSILKSAVEPELDFTKAGAIWHSMFPPSNDRYAPTIGTYYKDTDILGTGSDTKLNSAGYSIKNKLFEPDLVKRDVYSLLESFCLAPLSDSSSIALGLSGGMDIRPLLAVYLRSGVSLSAIHYGNDNTADYHIGKQIADDYGIPHHHISYESAEGSDPWQQTLDFMRIRGITANPVNAPYIGYYQQVSGSFDTFVSGYFGELYRFRFFVAHLLSIFKGKRLNPADINAYLYRIPAGIFTPEVARQLHQGYVRSTREAFAAMPSPMGMPNPMWYNLFLTRYSPINVNMASLTHLDEILLDHMPWLQSGVISQHWHNSFAFQMSEGIHRTLLRKNMPALEKYPLGALHVKAPYYYRQYMVKVKMWQHYRSQPLTRESRSERFLNLNKDSILDLFLSRRVQEYPAYDIPRIAKAIEAYYKGDKSTLSTVMCWLAIELGR